MHVLLLSTYELGRQPFGLASPAAWLKDDGITVTCIDVSRQPLNREAVLEAALVAFYLPMHTAARLAVPAILRVREWHPAAYLCCYGLYAPLNEAFLRSLGVQSILGGEFEAALCELARRVATGAPPPSNSTVPAHGSNSSGAIPRLAFRVPDRGGLPPLNQYASLQLPGGERRVVGYTEASRGCKHRCRHCPVVPIYDGRFRVVQTDVVLEDIRRQVDAGARHITFGDPDFFNAPKAALALVESLARRFPGLSYDVTIKIEHLLRHAAYLPTLRDTGCLFVTSAVESIDDRVLRLLEKGHTRGDFQRAVALCRASGVALVPTFVAFTPWTTLEAYCELLSMLEALDLVEHVAPIQLAIRLLIPSGSRLLELEEIRRLIGPFDPATLAYPWQHPDPWVDRLQEEVSEAVGVRLNAPRTAVFGAIRRLAHHRAGLPLQEGAPEGAVPRATVPYLNEPWYC